MTNPTTPAGETKQVQTPKEESISSGKTASPTPTAVSSVNSPKRPKPVKKNTAGSPRQDSVSRESKLSIVQSALARLGESGVEVYAREEGGNLVITIVNVGMRDKKFVLK